MWGISPLVFPSLFLVIKKWKLAEYLRVPHSLVDLWFGSRKKKDKELIFGDTWSKL